VFGTAGDAATPIEVVALVAGDGGSAGDRDVTIVGEVVETERGSIRGRGRLGGCADGGDSRSHEYSRGADGEGRCPSASQNVPSPSTRKLLIPRISGATLLGTMATSYSTRKCMRLLAQPSTLKRPPPRRSYFSSSGAM
jgi:hypothetical protein